MHLMNRPMTQRPAGLFGPGPSLLADPSDLAKDAMRANPSMERWPCRWQTRYDFMASCGDDRDWFRSRHKQAAYWQVCLEFSDAPRWRRKLTRWHGDDHPRDGDRSAERWTVLSPSAPPSSQ